MVYLFLADGFEEIEALTPTDVLRRAGVEVKTISITGDRTVTGAHGIKVTSDLVLDEYKAETAEMIVFPGGGEGTRNLDECERVHEIILDAVKNNLYIAAICAAPTILAKMGLLEGLRATCYPSLATVLTENKAKYKSDKVVCDKRFITSMGPGTSGEFAFTLVDKLVTKKDSDNLRIAMVY
jgi:4-methyl-5(b-hydroxyethyl)-thiazole monophosphate biosynthesis